MICVPGFIGDALGLLLLLGPVRHLLIRFGGRRVARRVQTMRSGRWSVIDVQGWPAADDPQTPTGSAPSMIEPESRSNGPAA
jgi:UPF0716 family protein affecting phage T7 exclusion